MKKNLLNRRSDIIAPEILKAKDMLESKYCSPFKYLKTTHKGKYRRHHFKTKSEKIIYIILTDKEREKITQDFKMRFSTRYEYKDTILLSIFGNRIQHRFYIPDKPDAPFVFMDEDGLICGLDFEK